MQVELKKNGLRWHFSSLKSINSNAAEKKLFSSIYKLKLRPGFYNPGLFLFLMITTIKYCPFLLSCCNYRLERAKNFHKNKKIINFELQNQFTIIRFPKNKSYCNYRPERAKNFYKNKKRRNFGL